MKLAKYGIFSAVTGLTVVGAMAAWSAGCSSSPAGDGGTEGGSGQHAKPPEKPASAMPTTATDEFTYAIDALYLGDTPRTSIDQVSTTAWKDYGFDVDGKITDSKSTDVCQRASGAPSSTQEDGNQGRDNSFGRNILPIIQSAGSIQNASKTISDQVKAGAFTIQFKVKGLTQKADQTATGLSANLFASTAFDKAGMAKPTFTTADDWPVRPELLKNPNDISAGSKVQFTGSYIVNGSYVSGDPSTVTLSLAFQGVALDLEITNAVIVMDINGASANNGTIAGVINTKKLIDGLRSVAGRISKSLCGNAFDGIAQQINQTSDILSNGTNAPGQPCDAISIGIGFSGKQIKNPTKISNDDGGAPPDPCADSGAPPQDSGGGG